MNKKRSRRKRQEKYRRGERREGKKDKINFIVRKLKQN